MFYTYTPQPAAKPVGVFVYGDDVQVNEISLAVKMVDRKHGNKERGLMINL